MPAVFAGPSGIAPSRVARVLSNVACMFGIHVAEDPIGGLRDGGITEAPGRKRIDLERGCVRLIA